jgi:hypothetical protein
MDFSKILAELRKECEQIKEAILSLERSAGPDVAALTAKGVQVVAAVAQAGQERPCRLKPARVLKTASYTEKRPGRNPDKLESPRRGGGLHQGHRGAKRLRDSRRQGETFQYANALPLWPRLRHSPYSALRGRRRVSRAE